MAEYVLYAVTGTETYCTPSKSSLAVTVTESCAKVCGSNNSLLSCNVSCVFGNNPVTSKYGVPRKDPDSTAVNSNVLGVGRLSAPYLASRLGDIIVI
jgi:hypothetical protein